MVSKYNEVSLMLEEKLLSCVAGQVRYMLSLGTSFLLKTLSSKRKTGEN